MIGPEQLAAGERAEALGDYISAAAAYRAVVDVPDIHLSSRAQFCLGRVNWRQGRFDAALAAFRNSEALAEQTGDVELRACVANGIGAVHYARGDYAAARQSYAIAASLTPRLSRIFPLIVSSCVKDAAIAYDWRAAA